jgi:hypothetical protein
MYLKADGSTERNRVAGNLLRIDQDSQSYPDSGELAVVGFINGRCRLAKTSYRMQSREPASRTRLP